MLDRILNCLELRHSRTESGLGYQRAKAGIGNNELNRHWASIHFRKGSVILAKLAEVLARQNISMIVYSPNEAGLAAYFRARNRMNFPISEQVLDWGLKEALDKEVTPEMGKGRQIELGEVFTSPVIWATPRNQYVPTETVNGKKFNYLTQLTIVKGKIKS